MSLGYNPIGEILTRILASAGEVTVHLRQSHDRLFATAKVGSLLGTSMVDQGTGKDFEALRMSLQDLENKISVSPELVNSAESEDTVEEINDPYHEDEEAEGFGETIDLEDAIATASSKRYDAVQESLDALKKAKPTKLSNDTSENFVYAFDPTLPPKEGSMLLEKRIEEIKKNLQRPLN